MEVEDKRQPSEESTWQRYISKQIEEGGGLMHYFINRMSHERIFLNTIKQYAYKYKNPKLLDIGCGSALHAVYLSYFFENVVAMDIDPGVVELARKSNQYLHGRVKAVKGDMFSFNDTWDVIFSWGVYEHFSDNEIMRLIDFHLSKSDYLIFVVPSKRINKSTDSLYGDERLFSTWELRRLVKLGGGKILDLFGMGYSFKPFKVGDYAKGLSSILAPFAKNIGVVTTRK